MVCSQPERLIVVTPLGSCSTLRFPAGFQMLPPALPFKSVVLLSSVSLFVTYTHSCIFCPMFLVPLIPSNDLNQKFDKCTSFVPQCFWLTLSLYVFCSQFNPKLQISHENKVLSISPAERFSFVGNGRIQLRLFTR